MIYLKPEDKLRETFYSFFNKTIKKQFHNGVQINLTPIKVQFTQNFIRGRFILIPQAQLVLLSEYIKESRNILDWVQTLIKYLEMSALLKDEAISQSLNNMVFKDDKMVPFLVKEATDVKIQEENRREFENNIDQFRAILAEFEKKMFKGRNVKSLLEEDIEAILKQMREELTLENAKQLHMKLNELKESRQAVTYEKFSFQIKQ